MVLASCCAFGIPAVKKAIRLGTLTSGLVLFFTLPFSFLIAKLQEGIVLDLEENLTAAGVAETTAVREESDAVRNSKLASAEGSTAIADEEQAKAAAAMSAAAGSAAAASGTISTVGSAANSIGLDSATKASTGTGSSLAAEESAAETAVVAAPAVITACQFVPVLDVACDALGITAVGTASLEGAESTGTVAVAGGTATGGSIAKGGALVKTGSVAKGGAAMEVSGVETGNSAVNTGSNTLQNVKSGLKTGFVGGTIAGDEVGASAVDDANATAEHTSALEQGLASEQAAALATGEKASAVEEQTVAATEEKSAFTLAMYLIILSLMNFVISTLNTILLAFRFIVRYAPISCVRVMAKGGASMVQGCYSMLGWATPTFVGMAKFFGADHDDSLQKEDFVKPLLISDKTSNSESGIMATAADDLGKINIADLGNANESTIASNEKKDIENQIENVDLRNRNTFYIGETSEYFGTLAETTGQMTAKIPAVVYHSINIPVHLIFGTLATILAVESYDVIYRVQHVL